MNSVFKLHEPMTSLPTKIYAPRACKRKETEEPWNPRRVRRTNLKPLTTKIWGLFRLLRQHLKNLPRWQKMRKTFHDSGPTIIVADSTQALSLRYSDLKTRDLSKALFIASNSVGEST